MIKRADPRVVGAAHDEVGESQSGVAAVVGVAGEIAGEPEPSAGRRRLEDAEIHLWLVFDAELQGVAALDDAQRIDQVNDILDFPRGLEPGARRSW